MSEFNLSLREFPEGYFPKDKVKEFIERLKIKFDDEFDYSGEDICSEIDKLAGEKLI